MVARGLGVSGAATLQQPSQDPLPEVEAEAVSSSSSDGSDDEEEASLAEKEEAINEVAGPWGPNAEAGPCARHRQTRYLHLVRDEAGTHLKCESDFDEVRDLGGCSCLHVPSLFSLFSINLISEHTSQDGRLSTPKSSRAARAFKCKPRCMPTADHRDTGIHAVRSSGCAALRDILYYQYGILCMPETIPSSSYAAGAMSYAGL